MRRGDWDIVIWRKPAKGIVLALLLASSSTVAENDGDYELMWNTANGGGVRSSSGGVYKLGSTIGQPDAGKMSGGEYALSGGFWQGDADGDAMLDGFDQCLGVDDASFAPGCMEAIPTVSEWGLLVMALLLMAGGKIYFRRPREAR